VSEHQLDDAMSTPSAEPTGAFVPQVVPVQIDLVKLRAIDASARLRTLRLVAVGDQQPEDRRSAASGL
jgi:hypothetical protein